MTTKCVGIAFTQNKFENVGPNCPCAAGLTIPTQAHRSSPPAGRRASCTFPCSHLRAGGNQFLFRASPRACSPSGNSGALASPGFPGAPPRKWGWGPHVSRPRQQIPAGRFGPPQGTSRSFPPGWGTPAANNLPPPPLNCRSKLPRPRPGCPGDPRFSPSNRSTRKPSPDAVGRAGDYCSGTAPNRKLQNGTFGNGSKPGPRPDSSCT